MVVVGNGSNTVIGELTGGTKVGMGGHQINVVSVTQGGWGISQR